MISLLLGSLEIGGEISAIFAELILQGVQHVSMGCGTLPLNAVQKALPSATDLDQVWKKFLRELWARLQLLGVVAAVDGEVEEGLLDLVALLCS